VKINNLYTDCEYTEELRTTKRNELVVVKCCKHSVFPGTLLHVSYTKPAFPQHKPMLRHLRYCHLTYSVIVQMSAAVICLIKHRAMQAYGKI
jgi:hypothetical protein